MESRSAPAFEILWHNAASVLDQGYGRGGTPIFTGVFEPLARVALYPTDEDGSGTCFGAAQITFALRVYFANEKHEEYVKSHRNKGVTRASDPWPLK